MIKLNVTDQFPLESALLASLLQAWGISSFSFQEAKHGIENRTIFITEPSRKGVLRIYRQDRKSVSEIREELEYMDSQSRVNSLIPKIYPTTDGHLFAETILRGALWQSVFMEHKPGEHPPAYTEQMVIQMGKALAELHVQSLAYQCSQTHNSPISLQEDRCKKIRQTMPHRPDIQTFIRTFETLEIQAIHLPSSHIHGDFIRTNLLWKDGTLTGLLDFDDTEYHWLVLDVATSAWHISLQESNLELATRFIESYETIRPLNEEERTALFPLIHLVNGFRGSDQILLEDFDEEWEQILKLEAHLLVAHSHLR